MWPISEATHNLVLSELKVPGATASRVARRLALPYSIVLKIAGATQSSTAYSETNGGYGPIHKRQFLVTRKKVTEAWDNEEPKLKKVRKEYNEGLVELATGRDGDWILLYRFPRQKVVAERNYFPT